MVGIASLAPGQAQQGPMPGMMPKPQGVQPGVPALVPSLVGMDMGQLLQMFADPNSPVPKNRLIAAMTEQQQAAEAKAAVERQMAMAQNAAAPTGTIAQQVVQRAMRAAQPTQMAAHGGIMQGYAGGGAVAFQTAGVVPPGLLNPDVDEEGLPRGKDERQQIIDYNNRVRAAYEQQMKSKAAAPQRPAAPSMQDIAGVMAGRRQLEQFYKPRDPEAYTPERVGFKVGDAAAATPTAASVPMSMQDTRGGTPEMAALAQMLGSGAAPAPGPSAAPGGQRRQPSAAPAPATQPALAPQAGLSPEMEAYFRNRASDLRTREGLPEDVLVGRAGLEALARANIEAQKSEAKTYGDEIRAARDAALARAQRGLLDDPQALLALAGSIDTRKGQGIGSLARGAAGLMSQREAAAEAARKEYATAQQTERALQANVRQATMLEAQRAQALRENDFNRANQIKDQIDALMMQRETLLMERRDKAIEQARLERGLNIQERGVRAQETIANKPTAREFEYALFKTDPEKYKAFLAAGAEPKSEGAMLKEIVGAVLKNPLMMQQYPPAIQALVNQELLKLGVTSALPKGAGVRE